MISLSPTQFKRVLAILVALHILIIAVSNYLVQIPVTIYGLHTTWGTFSFPFVYLATDLTVRIFGAVQARKIVFGAMLPALVFSYLFSVLFLDGVYQGAASLGTFSMFAFRIAFASFTAYLLGQLADIKVFSRLRTNARWWVAPSASTIFGNMLDTAVFYFVAFFACSDPFMATHWVEIGMLDYAFKLFVSLLLFLPIYGVILRILIEGLLAEPAQSRPAI